MEKDDFQSAYDAIFVLSVVIEMRCILVKTDEILELGAFPRRFWMCKIMLAGFLFRVVLLMAGNVARFGWNGICPFEFGRVVKLIATECTIIGFELMTRLLCRFVVHKLQI